MITKLIWRGDTTYILLNLRANNLAHTKKGTHTGFIYLNLLYVKTNKMHYGEFLCNGHFSQCRGFVKNLIILIFVTLVQQFQMAVCFQCVNEPLLYVLDGQRKTECHHNWHTIKVYEEPNHFDKKKICKTKKRKKKKNFGWLLRLKKKMISFIYFKSGKLW